MTDLAPPTPAPALGVGVIGFGWMGRVHTQAYSRVTHHFDDLGSTPRLIAVADEVPGRAAEAARRYGFARSSDDWSSLLADDEIEAISVTAPNFLHREIGVAVAEAGKHLWIEKPVGVTADDARAVRDAVERAGVRATVGFNYRNPPAVRAARELISSGSLGELTHASFRLLSDYAADPAGALSWRYAFATAGHGVLGDLAVHGLDLAWFLMGDVAEVVADTTVFIGERAVPSGATSGHQRVEGGTMGQVENEDYLAGILRFTSGARATVEVSRVAVGEQNDYGFTVHGTRGSVSWDFRRLGELQVSRGDRYQDLPVSRTFAVPGDGDYAAFQPGAAISMGYDDLKVIEAAGFLRSIADGAPHGAGLDDAVRAAETAEALSDSAATGRWVSVASSGVAR
ncbi:Gfo/Idh/MocA family oxidoreductase [Herbiconiux sp. KACC 21604]|uniref:Gfo/Idh/MocA family protein n=1 Tax=unclassified Herbiconiux TaxID=2618217 RepID=UPI001491DFC7|nr:Gfo/Idh/MocA family oxidoreductase [Herbiconiux sp. SALV-R1]QJU55244.1 Gfo/Idh/MocA family oxidoreductase [Herbiconiux sp. SALV-R1]WPO86411.1 Gfo/Idh/MocA family oxidoreductase [Herbiconiux sp. KACC 21604]